MYGPEKTLDKFDLLNDRLAFWEKKEILNTGLWKALIYVHLHVAHVEYNTGQEIGWWSVDMWFVPSICPSWTLLWWHPSSTPVRGHDLRIGFLTLQTRCFHFTLLPIYTPCCSIYRHIYYQLSVPEVRWWSSDSSPVSGLDHRGTNFTLKSHTFAWCLTIAGNWALSRWKTKFDTDPYTENYQRNLGRVTCHANRLKHVSNVTHNNYMRRKESPRSVDT